MARSFRIFTSLLSVAAASASLPLLGLSGMMAMEVGAEDIEGAVEADGREELYFGREEEDDGDGSEIGKAKGVNEQRLLRFPFYGEGARLALYRPLLQRYSRPRLPHRAINARSGGAW